MRFFALVAAVACHGPQQQPAQPPDLVAPLTATGVEKPEGLTWKPETGDKPAAAIFKNVTVLGAVSGYRFMAGMQSMESALGEKCRYCHAVPNDFKSDDKPAKVRAREMFRMNARILESTFAGEVKVTCWTCHRGTASASTGMKGLPDVDPSFPRLADADLARPAQEVFKDIKALAGVPAGKFGKLMTWFGQELGVKCTHCHVQDDFAAPTPRKDRARQMLKMTGLIAREFYGGNSPVHCGTCHRGEPKPLTAPPAHAN